MLFGGRKDSVSTANNKQGLFTGSMTVAWDNQYKQGNIMWKVPRNIQWNDNIIVREDEIAVFFRDGKAIGYLDQPNRYALTSLNAPILGKLVNELSGVRQQAEVYYIQKRIIDGKFGSKEPYAFRDPTFGVVNLKLFGEFRYKVSNPENFINQFVGTFNVETSGEVEDRLKDQLVIIIYEALGKMKENGMSVLDIPSSLTTIEQMVLGRTKENFDQYGIAIDKISGLNIVLPEEVQKAVDERASMGVLGVNYMQYQAGRAMVDAAKNPTAGAASTGVGLGAGIGMGYMMMGQMASPQAMGAPAPGAGAAQAPTKTCPKCGAAVSSTAKFCPNCGTLLEQPVVQQPQELPKCPKCNTPYQPGSKFCPNCGNPL
jgi:membrane protease subunit (stomatin/prohibitin family)